MGHAVSIYLAGTGQGPDRDRTGTGQGPYRIVPDRVDDGDRGADEDELHDDLACRQGFRLVGFGIALVSGESSGSG